MRGPLRGMLAGLGAWKLGGGCFSTVIIFVLLFWLLGDSTCGGSACGSGARPAILSLP